MGKTIVIILAAVLAAGLAVFGLKSLRQSGPSGPPLNVNIADVSPELLNKQEAQLVLSGLKVPVTLAVEKKDGKILVKSMAFEEALEVEGYQVTDSELMLTDAIGENYDPPVPLLRADLQQGETWDWKGTISSGANPYSVRAELSVNNEKLNLPGVDDNAVHVRMVLFIDGVGPKPAKRELGFWFVPKKGLIKRDFGAASKREPVSASAPEAAEES